jgi:hypothetical protein
MEEKRDLRNLLQTDEHPVGLRCHLTKQNPTQRQTSQVQNPTPKTLETEPGRITAAHPLTLEGSYLRAATRRTARRLVGTASGLRLLLLLPAATWRTKGEAAARRRGAIGVYREPVESGDRDGDRKVLENGGCFFAGLLRSAPPLI